MGSLKNNMLIIHLWALFLIAEMILLWFFSPDSSALLLPWLKHLFWPIWVPAMILIFIPIFMFRKKGKVANGDSYVNTQKLVHEGIFSIIRHPQYTGGIWMAIAMVLPNQSLLILILAVLAVLSFRLTIYLEEENLIKKFGDDYKNYKKNTSSSSIILGLIKSYMKKNPE